MAYMIRSRWLHQITGGMPTLDWNSGVDQMDQDCQAVIIVERRTVIAFDTRGEQSRVIVVEQWPLEAPTALGIPVHRHHVGEVVGRQTGPPDDQSNSRKSFALSSLGKNTFHTCASPCTMLRFLRVAKRGKCGGAARKRS